MKTLFVFFGVSAMISTSLSAQSFVQPVEDNSAMVQEEMKKTQEEVLKSWNQAKSRLSELKNQMEKAHADSKRRGEDEIKGKDLMEKYGLLLSTRYLNDKNDFEPGMQISMKDQDNMNKLFQSYLHSTPFRGQTSAGEAKRVLELGAKNLNETSTMHLNPSASNNSEIEILEFQIKNTENNFQKASHLTKSLGIDTSDRLPASR